MNENAKKWIEDLRKHPELQTDNKLADGKLKRFCCLGRACILFNENNPIGQLEITVDELATFAMFDKEGAVLPEKVRVWLGLKDSIGTLKEETGANGRKLLINSLAIENDNGTTFPKIADIIEANKKELFI